MSIVGIKLDKTAINFLYEHSFLSRNTYKPEDYVELQFELDDASIFCRVNTREQENKNYFTDEMETTLVYDSMFFAIVAYYIDSAIQFITE